MAAVSLPLQDAVAAIRGYEDRLGIAAVNDPGSVVLSGEREALGAVLQALAQREVVCRDLRVQYAFHSPQMSAAQAELVHDLQGLVPRDASMPIYSTVTGARIEGSALDRAYWGRNVREPVQLASAIHAAIADGYRTFVEIGPHPVLAMHLEQCLTAHKDAGPGLVLRSMRREAEERRTLMQSIANLFVSGHRVDWKRLHPASRRCVALPTYPWERKRYWVDAAPARPRAEAPAAPEATPALLSLLDASDDAAFAAQLGLSATRPDEAAAIARVLGALRSKVRQARAELETRPWLYTLEWRAKPLAASTIGGAGQWVVLVDEAGAGERLAELLEAAGGACLRVRRGDVTEQLAPDLWTVSASSVRELAAWWAARAAERGPVRGVIHMWSLTPTANGQDALDAALAQGVESALSFLQVIVEAESPAPPRLWLVTRGAVSVGEDDPVRAPEQAPLWGLGRVVVLEHREVWGGLVDLPADSEDGLPALVAQLLGGDDEDQVAVRAAGRFVPRLVRHRAAERPVSGSAPGTVLITGGLGALGLHVARWLVESGARHLCLISRRGATTPEAASAVASLVALGASVTVLQADVADAAAMRAVFAEIDARLPPLSGVIHTAGVLDDGLLMRQSAARFAKVFAPKIRGTWNLHTLTQDRPLQFFVMFSSMAAILGAPGQGNYAAANAFLDAFALHRRARGLPAHSVNWSAWREGGMAGAQLLESLEKHGMHPLAPAMAVQCLTPILAGAAAQVMVVDADWSRFRGIYESEGERPLLAEMPRALVSAPVAHESTLIEQLRSVDARERAPRMKQWLQRSVAEIMGFEGPEQVELGKGFFEMGLDSLMAMELHRRLHQALSVSLRTTVIFNHPSVAALSDFLIEELALGPSAKPDAPREATPREAAPLADPDSLTEEEAARLLEEQLAEHEDFLK